MSVCSRLNCLLVAAGVALFAAGPAAATQLAADAPIVIAKSDKVKPGNSGKPDAKDQDALKDCKNIADPKQRDQCVRNARSSGKPDKPQGKPEKPQGKPDKK